MFKGHRVILRIVKLKKINWQIVFFSGFIDKAIIVVR